MRFFLHVKTAYKTKKKIFGQLPREPQRHISPWLQQFIDFTYDQVLGTRYTTRQTLSQVLCAGCQRKFCKTRRTRGENGRRQPLGQARTALSSRVSLNGLVVCVVVVLGRPCLFVGTWAHQFGSAGSCEEHSCCCCSKLQIAFRCSSSWLLYSSEHTTQQ